MIRLFSSALLLCALATASHAQQTITDSFQHNGVMRSYILYVPPAYTPGSPAPLILNMHGLGSNAQQQQLYSNFQPIADTAGFLMVYPQGTTEGSTTYWNVGFGGTADDVGFLDTLITVLQSQYAIDAQRVFATGMSNGGYMSYILASELSSRIAAIASVTGTMTPGKFADANPGRPVPVMEIHGTADGTVNYNGFAQGVHIDSLVRFWRQNAGCNPTPQTTNLPNTNTTDGSTVTHYVWTGGTAGATVELYKVNGGSHTWPGNPLGALDGSNQDFNASAEIWRFFRQFTLAQFLSIGEDAGSSNAAPAPIFPNPATGLIHLPEAKTNSAVSIYGTDGRLLAQQDLSGSTQSLNIGQLPAGQYLARYQNPRGQWLSARFEKSGR